MELDKSIVETIIELSASIASGSGGVASSFIQNIGGSTKVATAEEVDTITFNASGSRILTMTHTSSLMELTSSTNYYYSKQTDNNLFFANLMGSQEAIIDKSTGLTKAGQFSFYFEDTQLGGWFGFNGENPLISTDDSGSYLMAVHGTDGEIVSMGAYDGLSSAGLGASAKPGNATGRVSIGVDGTQGKSRIYLSHAGSGSIIEIDNSSSTGISRITLGDGAVVFSGSAVEVINTTADTTIPIFDSTYTGLPTGMPSIVGGLHVLSSSIASGGGSGDRIESPDGTTVFIQAFDEEKLESYVSSSGGIYTNAVSGTYTDFGTPLPIINKQEMLESGDIKVLQTAIASSDLETGMYRTMVYTGVDLQNPDSKSSIELFSGAGSSLVRLRADDTGEFRLNPDYARVMVSGSTDPVVIVDSDVPNLPAGMNSIVHGLHVLSSSVASGGGSVSWSLQPAISDIDADSNKIVNLADPTGSLDAVNLQTMQSAISGAIGAIVLPDVSTWSEYSASQDINVGNNRITNLAEPVTGSDAATKAYVDAQLGASDRIKGGAGTTYEETEIGVGPDATGLSDVLLRGANQGDVFLEQKAREASPGAGWIGWYSSRSGYGRGYVRWTSSHAELYGSGPAGNFGHIRVDGANGGNIYFDIPGASGGGGYEPSKGIRLVSNSSHTPNIRTLPSNVNSILHGIKLGVDAHDALASMPAPPDLEWWDPVWTPVINANSVSNVECQYTRAYRAAGGSLVTLEGTITVEIDDDDTNTILSTPLPVPATGTGSLLAPATGVDFSRGDRAVCTAIITDLGSGPVLAIDATVLANATGVPATLTIGFRISYRAA